MDLIVTSVELSFPKKIGKVKCWAKILINDKLLITGIRLFEDDNGNDRYIRFPDRQPPLHATGGTFVNIAVVNTKDEELRKHITEMVFQEYDKHPKNIKNKKE